ncbi:GAP family protein [Streptomyces sp. NPDC048419]|uniref:GAP family protein n=1 Tax=Streptomyces sp. NPDC048419 TaxID=3365547 RepID=UPI00371D0715
MLQPWGLVGTGAASAVDSDLSTLADWLALTGYCLLATRSLITMEIYTVRAAAVANARLNALRSWLEHHQEQMIVALFLLLGLWLIARCIAELVT